MRRPGKSGSTAPTRAAFFRRMAVYSRTEINKEGAGRDLSRQTHPLSQRAGKNWKGPHSDPQEKTININSIFTNRKITPEMSCKTPLQDLIYFIFIRENKLFLHPPESTIFPIDNKKGDLFWQVAFLNNTLRSEDQAS